MTNQKTDYKSLIQVYKMAIEASKKNNDEDIQNEKDNIKIQLSDMGSSTISRLVNELYTSDDDKTVSVKDDQGKTITATIQSLKLVLNKMLKENYPDELKKYHDKLKKKITEDDLKNGVKILSLEAKNIQYETAKNGQYSLLNTYEDELGQLVQKNKYLKKLYNGVIPYSLDLLKLFEIDPHSFYKKDGIVYNKAVVNVKYNYPLYDRVQEERISFNSKKSEIVHHKSKNSTLNMSQKKLRDQLYEKGFKIDGTEFFQYKRSSSKSRINNTLFIRNDLHDTMLSWSRLWINFPKDKLIDSASVKAYESLLLSSIEDTIKINPKNIKVRRIFYDSSRNARHYQTIPRYDCE